jgi:hypothetical protein
MISRLNGRHEAAHQPAVVVLAGNASVQVRAAAAVTARHAVTARLIAADARAEARVDAVLGLGDASGGPHRDIGTPVDL